jgi:hypothetical protein
MWEWLWRIAMTKTLFESLFGTHQNSIARDTGTLNRDHWRAQPYGIHDIRLLSEGAGAFIRCNSLLRSTILYLEE